MPIPRLSSLLCSLGLFDSYCFQHILSPQLGSKFLGCREGVGAEPELELCQGEFWSWSTCLCICALCCNGIDRHNGNQRRDKTLLTGIISLRAKEAKAEGDRKQKGNKGKRNGKPSVHG